MHLTVQCTTTRRQQQCEHWVEVAAAATAGAWMVFSVPTFHQPCLVWFLTKGTHYFRKLKTLHRAAERGHTDPTPTFIDEGRENAPSLEQQRARAPCAHVVSSARSPYTQPFTFTHAHFITTTCRWIFLGKCSSTSTLKKRRKEKKKEQRTCSNGLLVRMGACVRLRSSSNVTGRKLEGALKKHKENKI